MKCPVCNGTPISPLKFAVSINLNRIACANCGTRLKRTQKSQYVWHGATYGAIAFGLGMITLWIRLEENFGWSSEHAYFLIVGLVFAIGIPVEILLFKHVRYDVEKKE